MSIDIFRIARIGAMAAAMLLAATGAMALGGEVDMSWLDEAVVAHEGGSAIQTDTGIAMMQGAVSHSATLADGLSLSGSAWALADSLPSYDPQVLPTNVLDFSSRVLELDLKWEALPGSLVFEAGKKIIHPSSTFFKAPLDIMTPPSPAISNTSEQSASAVGKWEEGLVGAGVTWLTGPFSFYDYVSPRFVWSDQVSDAMLYFTGDQERFQNLAKIGARIGDTDIQLLGLYTSSLSGDASDDRYAAGVGIDSELGDSVTVRAEASAFNTTDRLVASGPGSSGYTSSTESVSWAPRGVLGATWSNADELSVMVEYYYNALGQIGSAYTTLIDYSSMRAASSQMSGAYPDILEQYGDFESAMHYGFCRLAGKLDQDVHAESWLEINLQDASALYGMDINYVRPTWSIEASLLGSWGGRDTEAALLFPIWRAGIEADLFF
jgi:hypothetical protein